MSAKDPRVLRGSTAKPSPKIVTVRVGTGNDEFSVHEELVCASSPFFEAAMKPHWKEAKDRLVELPEDTAEIFGIYIQWLYTKGIASLPEDPSSDSFLGEGYSLLASAYVLGEKLQDIAFKNDVVDAIMAESFNLNPNGQRLFPGCHHIKIIYDGTPKSSLARRLLVDMYVRHGTGTWISDSCTTLPRDFLVDLAIAQYQHRTNSKGVVPNMADTSAYHERGESGQCL
ncbi:hypothetical protein BJ546DRAFT_950332 [Cryomyces antarcticus]|nr:hypothetical protein LTR04_004791 [Oleoguttula sp. CCFEE 6159]